MAFYRPGYPQSNPPTPQVFPWEITPSEHDTTPQPMTPLVTHYSTPEEQEVQHFLQQQHQLPTFQPQAHLQQPQPQQQQQQQPEYQQPATIQLPERPVYTAQYRFDNVTQEDFRQQQEEAAQSDDRKAETSGSRRASSKPPLHISTTSRASVSPSASSSATGSRSAAIGPSRHTRGSHSAHPYRRPHSAAAIRGSVHGTPRVSSDPIGRLHPARIEEREREPEVALDPFAQIPAAQSTRQAFASSTTLATRAGVSAMSVTCPAVSLWRDRVLRTTSSGEAGSSANPQAASRRYTICTDIQFDTVDNVVVAMFELPGVKKADIRISLATCPFSRAKQLTVSGSSRCALATERGHTVLERKFGDFAKSICVPPETQPHDVHATMEDGVLTLRIPGGQPTQVTQPEDVSLV